MGHTRHRTAAAALVAALALTLAACSSDDDGGDDSGGSGANPTAAGAPGGAAPPQQTAAPAPAAPGAVPGAVPPAAAPGVGSYYVALGDSYAAGVKIPDTVAGSPAGCSRSTNNYAHLMAVELGVPSFADATCGGATTTDLGAPQTTLMGGTPAAPQFDVLGPETRLVTLGIGGNDIGFGQIMTTCVTSSFDKSSATPCKNAFTKDGQDVLKQRIDATGPKIDAALRTIREKAPQARVLVVGYPAILPETGSGCPAQLPVAVGDLAYLRGVVRDLNGMISARAAAGNATYVDTYTPGIGHDVCQPVGVKWVEGIAPESPGAQAHPNALGHKGMAAAVIAKARQQA